MEKYQIQNDTHFSLHSKTTIVPIENKPTKINELIKTYLYKYIDKEGKEYEIKFVSEDNIMIIDIKNLSTSQKFRNKLKINDFINKDKYFTLYFSISQIVTLFNELIKESLFKITINQEEIIITFFIFNITKKEIDFPIKKRNQALYNFLPKDYKTKSKEIKNNIYKKYINNTPSNVNVTKNKNPNANNENVFMPKNPVEIIRDIDVFSAIIKEEIIKEKQENPEKLIPLPKAIESPKNSSLFAIGVLASFLEKNGTEVAIEKENETSNEEKENCLKTCLQMATSEIGLSEKYELKFDFDEKKNQTLLEDEEEAEKFLSSWKKILSKELSIPENDILFFNPRKGSYIVDVKFIQQPANDLLPEFENLPKKYKELLEVRQKVLFQGCLLSPQILDENYNKQLGTWNKSNIMNRGNERYNPPHGWLGFGLDITKYSPDRCWIGKQNAPGEWIVVYHGVASRRLTPTQVINKVCENEESHLIPGLAQACEYHIDSRHKLIGNGKCSKCDRIFPCSTCNNNFTFSFDRCSDEEKVCICGKRFKCNQCLHGVYCSPDTSVLQGYATSFSLNNTDEEKYKIGFMLRADPNKIRQSSSVSNYYISSGEFDEFRPYRLLIKEVSIESIENWTHKKIKSIIFDSDEDNWDSGREFSNYIIGKSNLLFMIDDVQNNRFGGYISSQIIKADTYIKDPNAFIFSLRSNKRLPCPTKFGINNPDDAFISITTHERYIFAFGGGYDIKLDSKKTSYMGNSNPCSYNFGANKNALYGKTYPDRFTPKRWVVYQME